PTSNNPARALARGPARLGAHAPAGIAKPPLRQQSDKRQGRSTVASIGIKELLEAGVHFGHQTRRWNPKMRRFIHGEREGIYLIDLLQTDELVQRAQKFVSDIAHRGGTVLFVGTKKQARDAVKDAAERASMPY